jgi:hypothetical protein
VAGLSWSLGHLGRWECKWSLSTAGRVSGRQGESPKPCRGFLGLVPKVLVRAHHSPLPPRKAVEMGIHSTLLPAPTPRLRFLEGWLLPSHRGSPGATIPRVSQDPSCSASSTVKPAGCPGSSCTHKGPEKLLGPAAPCGPNPLDLKVWVPSPAAQS